MPKTMMMKPILSFIVDRILEKNDKGTLGTCSSFFKTMDLFKWTSPWLTMVAREPTTMAIFLLLGHGL